MAFAKKKTVPEGLSPEGQETDLKPNKSDLKPLGKRLKQAREEAGYSQVKLGREVGIPEKSLQKMEYGIMDLPASRMKPLCNTLGVSPTWLCEGKDDDADGTPARRPAKAVAANDQADEEVSPLEHAMALLSEMDELREDKFNGARRTGNALLSDLLDALKRLEPSDLSELAKLRDLYEGACPSEEDLWSIFGEMPMQAQDICGRIDERLADTAVLGIDLYAIDLDALSTVAHNLQEEYGGFDLPFFISESAREKMIKAIRPALRPLAFAGKAPDFSDTSAFPRRK